MTLEEQTPPLPHLVFRTMGKARTDVPALRIHAPLTHKHQKIVSRCNRTFNVFTPRWFPTALRFHGFASQGASRPAFIECTDGHVYLVKFHSDAPHPKMLVNESLGAQLGRKLCLPIPTSSLIWVPAEFIEAAPELTVSEPGVPARKPGLHFGILRVEPLFEITPDVVLKMGGDLRLLGLIMNRGDMAGAIVLDMWLLNEDRRNPENCLLQTIPGSRTTLRYYVVDHNLLFGSQCWDPTYLQAIEGWGMEEATFHPLNRQTLAAGCFDEFLARLENDVDDAAMESVLDSIPSAWGMTETEEAALRHLVETRRATTRGHLAATFPGK